MILAVIPARGGSKRIPGKNTRLFCGQPMIKYSIDAAINSGLFDRVIVSTDCDQIAQIAAGFGAEVPFLRPNELSGDHTPTIPVIRHAIESISTTEQPVDTACCIYATAPFIKSTDIQIGLSKLRQNSDTDFAFAVTTFASSVFRSLRMHDGRLEMIYPERVNTRSQDLPEAWHDAGQFYWGTANAWRTADGVLTANSVGIPIERYRVHDIDTLEDWKRAELMYSAIVDSND